MHGVVLHNPMTHEQMYEAVRAKVIEACPDAAETIRISHILRAMQKINSKKDSRDEYYLNDGGIFFLNAHRRDKPILDHNGGYWNLPSDDLAKQSPEVIKFLYSILVE